MSTNRLTVVEQSDRISLSLTMEELSILQQALGQLGVRVSDARPLVILLDRIEQELHRCGKHND